MSSQQRQFSAEEKSLVPGTEVQSKHGSTDRILDDSSRGHHTRKELILDADEFDEQNTSSSEESSISSSKIHSFTTESDNDTGSHHLSTEFTRVEFTLALISQEICVLKSTNLA